MRFGKSLDQNHVCSDSIESLTFLTFVDSAMTICCFKGVDMTSCRIDYICGPGWAAKHVPCTLEYRYIPKIYFPVQRYRAGHNIKAIPEDKECSVPC